MLYLLRNITKKYNCENIRFFEVSYNVRDISNGIRLDMRNSFMNHNIRKNIKLLSGFIIKIIIKGNDIIVIGMIKKSMNHIWMSVIS